MAAPAAAKRPCWPPAAKRHRTAAAAPMADAPAAAEQRPRLHPHRREPPPPHQQQQQPLLPGLPDHLAQLCLAPLPPRLLHAVCRPWRRLLSSPSFPPYLSLYAVLDGGADSAVSFAAYDAVSGRWDELPAPPMPSSPPRLWHPSFLSRRLPLQSVSTAGRLVVVAGSTHSLTPALPRPVVFDPTASPPQWRLGPPFPFAPRRWCAAGSARGRVFVAGGVGAGYDATDARSAATWDPVAAAAASPEEWEPLPPMRDCRFSRDAAEAVCSGGKVCMVSLRGRGAKEGAVFDLEAGRWEDMPPGMLAGWKGSAAAADDETIFVVDEERGALSAYDWGGDRWRTVVESERLKGAAEMAAGGGRVCVAAEDGAKVIVVDVTPQKPTWRHPPPPRMWEVAAPEGKRVVALHVLPRMPRAE
ncbi:unnamed protein product [Urochloa decumbens]|uniref:F-box/kelch-repeat protein SKIP25 n=1 Tax=Urochloa decumbens TaxID=240449 RepID=A0ABC9DJD0_9POAL